MRREENQLADQLANLAIDTDAAVDQVLTEQQRGAGRAQLATLLARAAQVYCDAA